MERNLRRTYGLENYIAVAALHSEKTSGEPIKGAMKFLGISVIRSFFTIHCLICVLLTIPFLYGKIICIFIDKGEG